MNIKNQYSNLYNIDDKSTRYIIYVIHKIFLKHNEEPTKVIKDVVMSLIGHNTSRSFLKSKLKPEKRINLSHFIESIFLDS